MADPALSRAVFICVGGVFAEVEALADRRLGVNRPERPDVLGHDLTAGAAGLDQAGLKAASLPPESDEHGVVA